MRISKFDSNKAQDKIEALEGNIEQVKHDLEHLIDFAIAYFKLKEKYGKGASDKQNFVF
jgi:topoisomerase-4 subunit A